MIEQFFFPFLESYCVEAQCKREATIAFVEHCKTLAAQEIKETDPSFSAVFFVIGHSKRPAVCGRIKVGENYLRFASGGLERMTVVEDAEGSDVFDELWADACDSKSWVDI